LILGAWISSTCPFFSAAALVFASVLAGLFSARSGFSFLLVFLFAGILAAEDGLGGYRLNDNKLSFWVGNLALAVMLLEGGLAHHVCDISHRLAACLCVGHGAAIAVTVL
jgi:NhaP-type Na+/H+ and K+/H+ antiporter